MNDSSSLTIEEIKKKKENLLKIKQEILEERDFFLNESSRLKKDNPTEAEKTELSFKLKVLYNNYRQKIQDILNKRY